MKEKNKHLSEDLYTQIFLIMHSDDDQPVIRELFVGLDRFRRLMICMDHTDYDEPDFNCSTAIVVNTEDSHAMARRHRIKHDELPRLIADSMADWDRLVNPTPNQVRDCMKEIAECLLDEGCRFKVIRTYGRRGYMCA